MCLSARTFISQGENVINGLPHFLLLITQRGNVFLCAYTIPLEERNKMCITS